MNNLKFICEGFINDLQGKFNQEERDIKSKFFKLDKKSRHFKKRYKNQNIFSDFRVEYINNGFSIEAKTKENTFEFGILYFEALKKFILLAIIINAQITAI